MSAGDRFAAPFLQANDVILFHPASQKVRPHRGVRTERYKLIHYYQSPEESELYDLESDPGEKQNLYPEHAALTEKLKNRIAELRQQTGDTAAA